MVTQYVSVKDIIGPIKDWTESYNYQAARAQCETLCDNFRKDCSPSAAVAFCEAKASVDLNKNTRTGEKGVGNLVAGVPLCEDGVYCFHIYPECDCGTTLTSTECLQYLCNYYEGSVGYDPETSMKAIQSEVGYGSCNPNTVNNSMTGKRADSWWRDAGYDSKTCADLGGERLTTTTSIGQLSKFSLSNCQVNSQTSTFSCSATGSCSTGQFTITDSANSVGSDTLEIKSSTVSGTYSLSGNDLTPGACTFSYTCYDPGKQQTIKANGCTIS